MVIEPVEIPRAPLKRGRFSRVTAPRRIVPGASLLLLGVMGCSVPVAQGIDENAANQAVVTLQRGGVAANKDADPKNTGLFQVTVSRAESSYAVALLASEGTPGRQSPGMAESLGGASLIPSPRSEQARILMGIAGEIEHSLLELDGVLSARVHLGVADPDALRDTEALPSNTASVLLRYREGQTPITAQDVSQLVSGAVSGLAPERVNVVLKAVSSAPARLPLSRLGPITVSRGSVGALRWIIGSALLMNVILGVTVTLLWRRLRSDRSVMS